MTALNPHDPFDAELIGEARKTLKKLPPAIRGPQPGYNSRVIVFCNPAGAVIFKGWATVWNRPYKPAEIAFALRRAHRDEATIEAALAGAVTAHRFWARNGADPVEAMIAAD